MRLGPFSSFCRRVPLGPTVLFGAAVALSGAARAEPVNATYEVYFGGLHVMTAEALWDHSPGSYHLAVKAETQGVTNWLNPWKGGTESRGTLVAGKAVPRFHENWGTTDEGEQLVELSYDPKGDLLRTIEQPTQDWKDRVPLPADAGDGTLDPLSAIAGVAEMLENSGRCEGTFPVFDGRRRYDLTVTDAGESVLKPSDYSLYAGPAHGCRIAYKMLGGQSKEHNKYVATAHDRIVWVARPEPGAPPIPVRLKIETDYGTLMAHLTAFTQGLQAEAKLTPQP